MNKNRGKKQKEVLTDAEVRLKRFLDMIAPSVIHFETDHYICGNTFRSVWALREYPTKLLKTTNTHSTSGNSMRRKTALKAHKSSIQRCFTF